MQGIFSFAILNYLHRNKIIANVRYRSVVFPGSALYVLNVVYILTVVFACAMMVALACASISVIRSVACVCFACALVVSFACAMMDALAFAVI